MGLLSAIGGVVGLVDDFHYSGEEKASDERAQQQLEIDRQTLALGEKQLAFETQALGAQQDMVLYLVGGAVAVAAVVSVALMSR